jgi:hypothetical protein
MRLRTPLLIFSLSLLGPGCSLVHDGVSVLASRTCDALQEHHEWHRNRKWAEEAWKQCQANATTTLSDDYAAGFKEGFAQFLYEGGNGEPPPLPPRQYRKLRYQSPEGYQAIEDWFAGYRQGSAAADDRGYRRWVTGPSSHSAGHPPPHSFPDPVRMPRRRIPFRVIPQQDEIELPAPRKAVSEGSSTPMKLRMSVKVHGTDTLAERGEK